MQQRLRYYLNHWGEPRFFKHNDDIRWNTDYGFPEFVYGALAYPVRIWLKHYQYRSPEQIQRRLLTRRAAIAAGNGFLHEAAANWAALVAGARHNRPDLSGVRPELAGACWEDRIVAAASLDYDLRVHG